VTNRLDARHRAEQAERMSHTGATWQEIAGQLGYRSRQAAQQAVRRLTDRTPPETVEQARAKHDGALRLLQRSGFTRYLTALQAGDDDTALRYSKELRSIIDVRAKLAGAYAPAQIDVNVSADPSAIIARAEADLLALVAEREQRQLPTAPIIDAEVIG
jgi:AraC-like DNA-binding protein